MPQRKGPHILIQGELWREQWIKGKSIIQIAQENHKDPQIISRAIWLAKWPEKLKELVFSYPDVFTRDVLINGFAGKRRQCEKKGFKLLAIEMNRMVVQGAGSKPVLKNTKGTKLKKKQRQPQADKTSPIYFPDKSLEAEFRIKQALSLHARVAFEGNGAGEVRIFFNNQKCLEFILERIENLGVNVSYDHKEQKMEEFLGFIE